MIPYVQGVFIAVATLVLGYSSAAPSCELMGLMPCLMPAMTFLHSPDFKDIQAVQRTGEFQNLTAPQLTSLCKTAQGIVTCAADYLERCMDHELKDLQVFARGTVKLLEVCDRPDLYAKWMVVIACNIKLNSSSAGYQSCLASGMKATLSMVQGKRNPMAAMELLRSGRLLRNVCCVMKDVNTCSAPEYGKCSPEAADLNGKIVDGVMDAYGCQAKVQDGCPVLE
ncbi:hypothetical protein BV898_04184 [Hypsibius exemplaris]|uniref:Secreted protein n=1 Tax=Hypsibius exemplaris TaxID=2072580 RepID=A0A1W0X3A4_HYPEX|nr:hypothetical protein BV898_04184 [Hypsibius exemplaris]